ncbi:unnamed protein product [Cylicocyclus nassatus]|uniref:O-methyltransferase n=1 Tax=Cylicocyclus nassatus TaxID=53992 RepID=A0AA36HEW8_CYLNA|nr:unnamed protein product [Cylicocyclus nassatus]
MWLSLLVLISLVSCGNTFWLPFENLQSLLEDLQNATIKLGTSESGISFSLSDIATDFFSGIRRFFSRINDQDKYVIAQEVLDFFNVTTEASFVDISSEQISYPLPYIEPTVAIQQHTVATTAPMRTRPMRTTTQAPSSQRYTAYSPVIIWPTTARTTTVLRTSRRPFTWRPVTPHLQRSSPSSVTPSFVEQAFATDSTTTDNIPLIVKARKFTRPPIVIDSPTVALSQLKLTSKYCQTGKKCHVDLRSFETTDPVFHYAYSHSSASSDHVQTVLRETQAMSFPAPLSWRGSVAPEVIQLTKLLMSLYQPSRCLIIGVFTGLGLLGIAEQVGSGGLIVALEHPSYEQFWENVGSRVAKTISHAYTPQIQLLSSEPIEKALSRLAANESNNFDFVFLDDFKRDNYLDDYEHSIRLLRSGGLLVINQALNDGGVLTGVEMMTESDRIISMMNVRIKEDGRVRASLLPFGGGTWIISKK